MQIDLIYLGFSVIKLEICLMSSTRLIQKQASVILHSYLCRDEKTNFRYVKKLLHQNMIVFSNSSNEKGLFFLRVIIIYFAKCYFLLDEINNEIYQKLINLKF